MLQPDDPATSVWRYLDLPKYLSLLQSSALFFARVDHLDDSWEGSFPRHNAQLSPQMGQLRKGLTQCTFVNCWHLSPHESEAMWRLYGEAQCSLAIRSTYQNLVQALPSHDPPILAGVVRYLDYETGAIPDDNTFHPFMHKRVSHQHEQEVRLLLQDLAAMTMVGRRVPPLGFHIELDIVELIDEVIVGPGKPSWISDVIAKVTDKYAPGMKVSGSGLDTEPWFT